MTNVIVHHEPIIRISAFAIVFAAMLLWEVAAPARRSNLPRIRRWPNNLAIAAINSSLLRLSFPVTAIGSAALARENGWGLLHQFDETSWHTIIVAIFLLDFAIYLQHRAFHAVPLLWRLHRMHHADLAFDVTTGVRFHPLEMWLSMVIKVGIVIAIGAPPLAVLLFEVILNATSLFNHGNVTLPQRFDRLLRFVVVTPDMHRIHHSVIAHETNSNFGFNVPWWDRIFRTYRGEPEAGRDGITIGLLEFRDPSELRLDRLLSQPFRAIPDE